MRVPLDLMFHPTTIPEPQRALHKPRQRSLERPGQALQCLGMTGGVGGVLGCRDRKPAVWRRWEITRSGSSRPKGGQQDPRALPKLNMPFLQQ
jgi:hypothetical protein